MYSEISATAVKFELRPTGTVFGKFIEDTCTANNTAGPCLIYISPTSGSSQESFEVVAVDAQGDKSTKGLVTATVTAHPIVMTIETTPILDGATPYSMGVLAKSDSKFHKIQLRNTTPRTLQLAEVWCNDANTSKINYDPKIYPNGAPTEILPGGTMFLWLQGLSSTTPGPVSNVCGIFFSDSGKRVAKYFSVKALVVGSNATPDFSPISIKVNVVSLIDPASGAVAGSAQSLDSIVGILNRGFSFGGANVVSFVRGTYRTLVSSQYVIKDSVWPTELNPHKIRGEVTYFIGGSFNSNFAGQADFVNSDLQSGAAIAIRGDYTSLSNTSFMISHEMGHVMNLWHSAQVDPARTFSLTSGQNSFCGMSAANASYPVYSEATGISAEARQNTMFYWRAVADQSEYSFNTGPYGAPMLNIIKCWKAINRITY